jgi:hypothetical protein
MDLAHPFLGAASGSLSRDFSRYNRQDLAGKIAVRLAETLTPPNVRADEEAVKVASDQ